MGNTFEKYINMEEISAEGALECDLSLSQSCIHPVGSAIAETVHKSAVSSRNQPVRDRWDLPEGEALS